MNSVHSVFLELASSQFAPAEPQESTKPLCVHAHVSASGVCTCVCMQENSLDAFAYPLLEFSFLQVVVGSRALHVRHEGKERNAVKIWYEKWAPLFHG